MTPNFFHPIWKRDNGECQTCGKKVYESQIVIENPYEETLNFLKEVKNQ